GELACHVGLVAMVNDVKRSGRTIRQSGFVENLLPDLTTAQRQLMRRAGSLPNRPDHAEVAHRRTLRPRSALEDDHRLSALRCEVSMGEAEDAGTHDRHVGFSIRAHRMSKGSCYAFARHLVYLREEERYAHPHYPFRGAIRTLQKVIPAKLETQILGTHLERLTDIRAHRNSPRVGGIGGPVVGDGGIDVGVPSALEVVADHRLDVGLIDAPALAISGKRHQLVGEDGVEPRALRVHQRRGWSGRPAAGSQFRAAGSGEIKNRTRTPDPCGLSMRC